MISDERDVKHNVYCGQLCILSMLSIIIIQKIPFLNNHVIASITTKPIQVHPEDGFNQ